MAVSETLNATGQSSATDPTKEVDISLSGTWTGTANLQREIAGTFVNTGDSWTANVETRASSAAPHRWRIDWTRTSGSLVVNLPAA